MRNRQGLIRLVALIMAVAMIATILGMLILALFA